MDASQLLVAISAVAIAYASFWIYRRRRGLKVFKEMGVPGPQPSLLGGNMDDVAVGTMMPIYSNERWRRQYGKVYGYFVADVPTLVVGELELVKQITVKDAHNFINRPISALDLQTTFHSLLGSRNERWKEVRKVLTPTFSSSKMKKLVTVMNGIVAKFMEVVDEKAATEASFDIYDKFQRLTLDVIGKCALATTIDSQSEEDHALFRCFRDTMKEGASSLLYKLLMCFPFLIRLLKFLVDRSPFSKMTEEILRNLRFVIKERRKRPMQTIDVLQLMLEASEQQESESKGREAQDQSSHENINSPKLTKPLSDDEIVANCWVFLLAGFETTATALAYTSHMLVVHQDIQERVHKEILHKIGPDQIPTYEEANSLQYLDQVINETLRIYPPVVLFITRECGQDYNLNGIKIPAGMKIEIPIYSIHHDPEIWPDPEKFDPERFSPENKSKIHPMAHIPFGAGPRNCIGMRFALLEAKLTLIRLLRKYRLEPCERTKDPPDVTVPHATFIPKNGIYLKVVAREAS